MYASAEKERPEASRLPETLAIVVTVHAAKLATITEAKPATFLGIACPTLGLLVKWSIQPQIILRSHSER